MRLDPHPEKRQLLSIAGTESQGFQAIKPRTKRPRANHVFGACSLGQDRRGLTPPDRAYMHGILRRGKRRRHNSTVPDKHLVHPVHKRHGFRGSTMLCSFYLTICTLYFTYRQR
jgi:hypothetical protein